MEFLEQKASYDFSVSIRKFLFPSGLKNCEARESISLAKIIYNFTLLSPLKDLKPIKTKRLLDGKKRNPIKLLPMVINVQVYFNQVA